jgi:hypothetical protein
MRQTFHRVITTQALGNIFSPKAMDVIVCANLGQDHWIRGQFGHPEYHFDNNKLTESQAYIDWNRSLIKPALETKNAPAAQTAFGRLIHAAQDFYAHSNYVAIWMERFNHQVLSSAEAVEPMVMSILEDRHLHSGKVVLALEFINKIPGLKKIILPFMPLNTHARMNLDSPERGPLFEYAYAAALQRTGVEFKLASDDLSRELLTYFCD